MTILPKLSLRQQAVRWARAAVSWLLTVLMVCLTPDESLVVVSSNSPSEGNASEVLRWLRANAPARVVWLVENRAKVASAERVLEPGVDVQVLPRRSVKGVVCFVRAKTVFFTDICFGGPRPSNGRLFVNLWHGDGPKTTTRPGAVRRRIADVVVAGTEVWGAEKARAFRIPPECGLVVSGNPRIDQFLRPASDGELRLLGIDSERPFALWAPTFRRSRGDVFDSAVRSPFSDLLQEGYDSETVGAQLVVKPHHFDVDSLASEGVIHVVDADLRAAGVGLYQLLARSSALITDYSSIWTDYIPLDRPIGFYCPDLEAYAKGRGFSSLEVFRSSLPGPLFESAPGLREFIARAVRTDATGRELRARATAELRIVRSCGATPRLMDALAERFGAGLAT